METLDLTLNFKDFQEAQHVLAFYHAYLHFVSGHDMYLQDRTPLRAIRPLPDGTYGHEEPRSPVVHLTSRPCLVAHWGMGNPFDVPATLGR